MKVSVWKGGIKYTSDFVTEKPLFAIYILCASAHSQALLEDRTVSKRTLLGKRAFMQGKVVCLGNGSKFISRFYMCYGTGNSLVYVVGYLGGFDGNFLWNRIGAGKSYF